MNVTPASSDSICAFFDSTKGTEVVKLREIMKLHNAIGGNFGSNNLRNFYRNAESRRVIAAVNTNMRSLISNLSTMLNNASKNIREM